MHRALAFAGQREHDGKAYACRLTLRPRWCLAIRARDCRPGAIWRSGGRGHPARRVPRGKRTCGKNRALHRHRLGDGFFRVGHQGQSMRTAPAWLGFILSDPPRRGIALVWHRCRGWMAPLQPARNSHRRNHHPRLPRCVDCRPAGGLGELPVAVSGSRVAELFRCPTAKRDRTPDTAGSPRVASVSEPSNRALQRMPDAGTPRGKLGPPRRTNCLRGFRRCTPTQALNAQPLPSGAARRVVDARSSCGESGCSRSLLRARHQPTRIGVCLPLSFWTVPARLPRIDPPQRRSHGSALHLRHGPGQRNRHGLRLSSSRPFLRAVQKLLRRTSVPRMQER